MRAAEHEQSVLLASRPEDIWPLIVDTDRLNRLMGLSPVRYSPLLDAHGTAARLVGETKLAGFHVTYEEMPFEWAYPKAFGVRRVFRNGPLAWVELHWTLDACDSAAPRGRSSPSGDQVLPINDATAAELEPAHNSNIGTRLTVRFFAMPRNKLFRLLVNVGGKRTVADLIDLGRAIDTHLLRATPSPFARPVSACREAALELATQELRKKGVGPDVAERLSTYVRGAPDADCVAIRPYELAELWKCDRREVLVACLYAVTAGLLELRWSITCPSCRTASAQVSALDEVAPEGHCQLCDIRFDIDLDRAVEASFVPHPAVRPLPPAMFCVAGPARTPHVLTQGNVDAHTEQRFEVPVKPGRYRVFARGGSRASLQVDEEGSREARVGLLGGQLESPEVHLQPGGILVIANGDADARHIKIERLEYASYAATGHDVATLPEFRALFSKELVKRGTPLKVARACILFSDLTGSTALYSSVGDAAAFRFVDDHFDVLRAAVKDAGGTVVKTMGDAVLASFVDEVAGKRAAIRCLGAFDEFRRRTPHGDSVHLKLGIYAGPLYVVTANGALDYFGQTVNVASRLQHLAEGGEIVMEAEAASQLARDDAAQVCVGVAEEVHVKGVSAPLTIVRVTIRATLPA